MVFIVNVRVINLHLPPLDLKLNILNTGTLGGYPQIILKIVQKIHINSPSSAFCKFSCRLQLQLAKTKGSPTKIKSHCVLGICTWYNSPSAIAVFLSIIIIPRLQCRCSCEETGRWSPAVVSLVETQSQWQWNYSRTQTQTVDPQYCERHAHTHMHT